MATNFLAQIGQILRRPVFSGMGGRSGGWGGYLRSTAGYDYRAEAGLLHENSIVLACLKWEQRASAELQLVVQRIDANGDWMPAPRHRAMKLLRQPNKAYSLRQLLNGIRFDYHTTGNAYVHKVRAASGQVVELYWIPSWMIGPRWEETGEDFISCYEYQANGNVYALPVEDVIHFRNGIDPASYGRRGLSDFYAVLREICTDNEASVFLAATLRNMGVPGIIVAPKSGAGQVSQMTKDERNRFKELWQESFTGERRGEPFMQSIPVDITVPGWSPQQLVLDKVRAIPEQRIAGSFGIPLSVLQLGSGLEHSNSRANKSDDRAQAYESCIIPTALEIADTLTAALLSDFGDNINHRCWFDTSNVRCLQADIDKVSLRIVQACGGPYMTINEARTEMGLAPITGGDDLRTTSTTPDQGTPAQGDNNSDPQNSN